MRSAHSRQFLSDFLFDTQQKTAGENERMQFIVTYHVLPEKGRTPYVKTKTEEETRKQETRAEQTETKANTAECKGQVVPVSV